MCSLESRDSQEIHGSNDTIQANKVMSTTNHRKYYWFSKRTHRAEKLQLLNLRPSKDVDLHLVRGYDEITKHAR